MTYNTSDRVRLTVPNNYPDHEGLPRRLGTTLVFRVLRYIEDDGSLVLVNHDPTGRRYVLPAKQLTRVG